MRWRHACNDRGIALVSVLWILALLTVVVSGLAANVRTETRAVGSMVELMQAQHAAEGGIELAAMNLMYPQAVRWVPDGSVRELDFGDARLRIAIRDETARIDLNHASMPLLLNLLVQAGTDVGVAERIVDAILDWRDGDDFRRLNGAEESDYRLAGLGYGPKNGAFESVDELRLVLGVDAEVFAAVQPALTVFSGQSGVNTTYASPQVVQAMAGLGNQESGIRGTTYTVQVEASIDERIYSQAEATINITYTGIGRPYDVLQWRQPRERLLAEAVQPEGEEL